MKPEIIRRRMAGNDHAVITIKADGGYCKRPCSECPWRRENAGNFPPEAFILSAPTAYDQAVNRFGCHMSLVLRRVRSAGPP